MMHGAIAKIQALLYVDFLINRQQTMAIKLSGLAGEKIFYARLVTWLYTLWMNGILSCVDLNDPRERMYTGFQLLQIEKLISKA